MKMCSSARLILLAVVTLIGCDAGHLDSGGSVGEALFVVARPLMISGHTDDDALDRVRGVTTSGRWLAVANSGSREVLLFDSTGSLVRRIGRDGEGPGEFRSLSSVQYVRGDSLLTFDSRLQRFSVFAPDGAYARSFRLRATDENELRGISVLGVVHDSIIVVQRVRLNESSSTPTGSSRALIDVLRARITGELLDTIAVVQGWEAYGRREGTATLGNMPVPFGRSSYIAVAGNQIVIALSDSNVVRIYGPEGALAHQIDAVAPEGPPVTAAEIAEFKKSAIENAPVDIRQQLSALYDEAPIPERKPPITWIYAGRDGTVWVRTAKSEEAHHLLVFSSSGDRIGEAQIPSAFSISEVDLRAAVGVWTDSLGVETVRRYSMVRR